jgi:hypothetical protein
MPRDPTRTVREAQRSSQRNGYALPHRRPVHKQPDRCDLGKVRRIQKERNQIAKKEAACFSLICIPFLVRYTKLEKLVNVNFAEEL